MRVPAHIRFTLAELTAFGLQSAEVLARANSAIHLVLTEQQTTLPTPEMEAACSIISVEDADGITVAVLKHRKGDAWDRREKPKPEIRGTTGRLILLDEHEPVAGTVRLDMPGRDPSYVAKGVRSEPEPVVPRREPPHAAPAGECRFDRGVKAMEMMLRHSFGAGKLRETRFTYGRLGKVDVAKIDGEFSLRGLAAAFLDAYQPQITISDQVRFGQAKRAMRLLLRKWRDDGNIEHLAGSPAAPAEEWADNIGDIISIEGTIDIDALAKAALSVMKEGEGQ